MTVSSSALGVIVIAVDSTGVGWTRPLSTLHLRVSTSPL